jgi:hypothetical protein
MKFTVHYRQTRFPSLLSKMVENDNKPEPVIFAEHIASPDCWCEPEPDHIEPDLYIHRERQ